MKKKETKRVNNKVSKLKKSSELLLKSNAKYLDSNYISQYEIDGNKWFIDTATTLKNKLIKSATIYEKSLCNFLKTKGLTVDFQKIIYIPNGYTIKKFYIADIYLPMYNLIIEVDGGYHGTKEQIEKDYNRTQDLISEGYIVMRVDNEDTFNMDTILNNIVKKYGK